MKDKYVVQVMRHPSPTYTFPLFTWKYPNRKGGKDQFMRAMRSWGIDPTVMVCLCRSDTKANIKLVHPVPAADLGFKDSTIFALVSNEYAVDHVANAKAII